MWLVYSNLKYSEVIFALVMIVNVRTFLALLKKKVCFIQATKVNQKG